MFCLFANVMISLLFLSTGLFANDQTEYPKLYESLWPDYCVKHLQTAKEACSENIVDAERDYFREDLLEMINSKNYEAEESWLNDEDYENYEDYEVPEVCYATFFPYSFYILANSVNKSKNLISFLPKKRSQCSYTFCEACKRPVTKALGIFDLDDEGYEIRIQHVCECSYLTVSLESQNYATYEDSDWYACKGPTVPFSYFNTFTAKYSSFLNQHLRYSMQNPSCTCCWPYVSKIACQISDIVYDKMTSFFQTSCLSNLMFKQSDSLLENTDNSHKGKNELLLRSLQNYFTFCFFYSNYHSVIIDLCSYVDANSETPTNDLNNLYSTLSSIRPPFLDLYSNCLEKHPHPKMYYERGMVYFHNGDLYASLSDMKAFVRLADENAAKELLTSDFYLQEGTSYAELGQYDEAIKALTKSISKDFGNKEAYFERAAVYFESGDFDLSLKDYLESGFEITPIDLSDLSTIEFSKQLISGIVKGSGEAVTDFIPSVLASVNGLSHGLWALVCDPVNCSKEMVDSCKGMLEFLSSSSGIEMLETFIPEAKDFNNAQSEEEKTTLLGFMIGKYGTEIFAPAGLFKVYKDLRSANRLLAIQNLSKTSKEATIIKEAAVNWNKAHLDSIEKFRVAEEFLRSYKGQNLSETTIRKILHQAGFKTFQKPKGVPCNFKVTFSDKGCGMKYINPNNLHESVRVMPGKPHSIKPHQTKPYIVYQKHGKTFDKFGNIVDGASAEAHIPVDEFLYRRGL